MFTKEIPLCLSVHYSCKSLVGSSEHTETKMSEIKSEKWPSNLKMLAVGCWLLNLTLQRHKVRQINLPAHNLLSTHETLWSGGGQHIYFTQHALAVVRVQRTPPMISLKIKKCRSIFKTSFSCSWGNLDLWLPLCENHLSLASLLEGCFKRFR